MSWSGAIPELNKPVTMTHPSMALPSVPHPPSSHYYYRLPNNSNSTHNKLHLSLQIRSKYISVFGKYSSPSFANTYIWQHPHWFTLAVITSHQLLIPLLPNLHHHHPPLTLLHPLPLFQFSLPFLVIPFFNFILCYSFFL